MTQMLASVANLDEAQIVLAEGADWIDIKEPRRGALGEVPIAEIGRIVEWIGDRAPTSATIGDCWDDLDLMRRRVEDYARSGAGYLKIGLYAQAPNGQLCAALRHCVSTFPDLIAVCFAEQMPSVDDITTLRQTGIRGIMLDTANKNGDSLLNLVNIETIHAFVKTARRNKLLTGLAGSLRTRDIAPLLASKPDYLGFRGALCHAGQRQNQISKTAVANICGEMRKVQQVDHEALESSV